jgi:hypothetical protein
MGNAQYTSPFCLALLLSLLNILTVSSAVAEPSTLDLRVMRQVFYHSCYSSGFISFARVLINSNRDYKMKGKAHYS